MFDFIKKMFGVTEKTVDAAVEEVIQTVKPIKKTRDQLQSLTKNQLKEYGRELGVEMDRRLSKAKLIANLLKEE